jgi:hypothetical protein
MSCITDVRAAINDGKLELRWTTTCEVQALSVQVAMDADFTTHLRNFVIPSTASFITLDLGGGAWFVRIGSSDAAAQTRIRLGVQRRQYGFSESH